LVQSINENESGLSLNSPPRKSGLHQQLTMDREEQCHIGNR